MGLQLSVFCDQQLVTAIEGSIVLPLRFTSVNQLQLQHDLSFFLREITNSNVPLGRAVGLPGRTFLHETVSHSSPLPIQY